MRHHRRDRTRERVVLIIVGSLWEGRGSGSHKSPAWQKPRVQTDTPVILWDESGTTIGTPDPDRDGVTRTSGRGHQEHGRCPDTQELPGCASGAGESRTREAENLSASFCSCIVSIGIALAVVLAKSRQMRFLYGQPVGTLSFSILSLIDQPVVSPG